MECLPAWEGKIFASTVSLKKKHLKERIKLFFNNIISIKLIKPNYIQFAEHLSRGRNPVFHQVLIVTMWNALKIPPYIRYTQMMIFIHPLLSLFLDWHALLEKSDEAKIDFQKSLVTMKYMAKWQLNFLAVFSWLKLSVNWDKQINKGKNSKKIQLSFDLFIMICSQCKKYKKETTPLSLGLGLPCSLPSINTLRFPNFLKDLFFLFWKFMAAWPVSFILNII